jgi:transposase-like protein
MRQHDLVPGREQDEQEHDLRGETRTRTTSASRKKEHVVSYGSHYHPRLLTRGPKSAQPRVATMVRTILEQPGSASVRARHTQVSTALGAKSRHAAAHLDEARDDVPAVPAFPAKSEDRCGAIIPGSA